MDLQKCVLTLHSWHMKCVGFISFLRQKRTTKLPPVKLDGIMLLLVCLLLGAATFQHCFWTHGFSQLNACGEWFRWEGLRDASTQLAPTSGLAAFWSPPDASLLSHCFLYCIHLHALLLALLISYLQATVMTDMGALESDSSAFDLDSTTYLQFNPRANVWLFEFRFLICTVWTTILACCRHVRLEWERPHQVPSRGSPSMLL